jgi:endonuclease YncB( thermonuclease family)
MSNFSIGTAGFIADVLLDPTTYLSGGTSALLKGAGRASIGVAKLAEGAKAIEGISDASRQALSKGTMTSEVAHKIVADQSARVGEQLSAEELSKKASQFQDKFHQLVGTNRVNENVGIGLKHSLISPLLKSVSFGNKTINKIADASVTIPGSAKVLEGISKATGVDRVYSKVRNNIYGSLIGKMFSTKHGLYKLASQDPKRIFDFMTMVERSQGLAGDKLAQQAMVREYAKQNLEGLHDSDVTKIMDALQDKTVWSKVKRIVDFSAMKEADSLKNQLQHEHDSSKAELDSLVKQHENLSLLKSAKDQNIQGAHDALQKFQDDFNQRLSQINADHLKYGADRKKYMDLLQKQADTLNQQYEQTVKNMPQTPEPVNVDPSTFPDKPKRPYTKKSDVPQDYMFEPIPEKPAYPKKPELADFVPKGLTELQHESSGITDFWKEANLPENMNKGNNGKFYVTQENKQKMYDQLSTLIYGKSGHILNGTYNRDINDIVKMIDEGWSKDYIKEYIDENKHRFDGRMSMIDSAVARHFGYGDDLEFKDWQQFYHERRNKILAQASKNPGGALNKSQWNLLQDLEKKNMERASMRATMQKMDIRTLKHHISELDSERLLKEFENVEESAWRPGQESWGISEDDHLMWKKTDQAKIRSKDELEREARTNRIADDYAERNKGALSERNVDSFSNTHDSEYMLNDKGQVVRRDVEGLKEINYRDQKGQWKSELVDKNAETVDKSYFRMSDDEVSHVKGLLYRDIVGDKTPKPSDLARIDHVVQTEMPNVLKKFFNKQFKYLTEKQKDFAVKMAYHNAFSQGKNGEKLSDKILAEKAQQILEKRAKKQAKIERVEAVKALVEKGSRITMKKNGEPVVGKVLRVEATDEGTFYTVHLKDGSFDHVKPNQVHRINKQRPIDAIMESTVENKIYKQLDDAEKAYQEEVARIDREHEQAVADATRRNENVQQLNEQRKADYEQKKADAQAQYEAKIADYHNQLDDLQERYGVSYDEFLQTKHETDLIRDHEFQYVIDAHNNKTLAEHEATIREQSKIADDYLQQSDDLLHQVENLKYDDIEANVAHEKWVNEVKSDFEMVKTDKIKQISDLERESMILQKQIDNVENTLINGQTVEQTRARIDELHQALNSTDAFESFLELKYPNQVKQWDAKYGNMNVGKIVLDTRTDLSDKVKQLVRELRGHFQDIGEKEVAIGRLEKGQVNSLVGEYLTHVVTSDGKKFFKDNMLQTDKDGNVTVVPRPQKEKNPSVTRDLGYGEVFNPYAMSRNIKRLKIGDKWVEKPTIAQINEAMRPFIKGGGNAFSENIADIYVARALKHTELMYDEGYMREMMRMFGEDLPQGVYEARKGFKTVMNYGLFKRNVRDIARVKASLEMDKDIAHHVAQSIANGSKPDVSKFLEEQSKNMQARYYDLVNEGYGMLGFDAKSYHKTGTPLLEMNAEQVKNVQQWHESALNELRGKYQQYLDDVQLNGRFGYPLNPKTVQKLEEYNEVLNGLTPLEIKEMHHTITNKANQARMLQIAKDKHFLLRTYDKFTHWMKISQTAMLPSFHVRNAVSNQFQNYLAVGNDVFDMKFQGRIMEALNNGAESKYLNSMHPMMDVNHVAHNWEELVKEAQARGVLDDGYFATELGANDEAKGFLKKLQDVKGMNLDPTSSSNSLARLGTKVGSKIEGQARFMQFVSHIKSGKTYDEATDLVNKYLFDYSDLTGFEQQVMKRIFPYYTWIRKNGKLQLEQLMMQPGKYRDTAKMINYAESGVPEDERMEMQYVAPFARDWIQYGGFDKKGKVNIFNPNMPYQDLSRLPLNPFDVGGNLEKVIPQMNVLPKEAIEQISNHEFFFNDKIQHDKEGADKRITHALNNYAPALQIHDLLVKPDHMRQLMSTAGFKTLNYDYATSKDKTIAKYLGKSTDKEKDTWTKTQIDKLRGDHLQQVVQGNATQLVDDYINGKDISKSKVGVFKPFADVIKEVGLDKAKNRQWVQATVEGTDLEKHLLGSDFTKGKITKVRDGDTIEVEINGKTQALRFNLIDTPEIKHVAGQSNMAFGQEAKKNMESLAPLGKDAHLVLSKHPDMHGRLVAYIYVDGQDINKAQLEAGMGKITYVNASTNPYKLDDYKQVQEDAYKKQRGIWQIPGYADPHKDAPYKKSAMKRYLKDKGE